MTPDQNPLLGSIEQILLVVFILMLFVGIAGGNPAMVLKPTLDIVGHIVGALLGLLCTLVATLFRVVLSLLAAALQAAGSMVQSTSSRNINRPKQ
ncbi:MAG TPA: hypothetical protein V6D17_15690 [Candidatus Obscuribacterales bacterium]